MEARIQRATAVLELEAQHPTVQSAAFVDNEADNCAMIKLHLSTTSFKTSSQKNHTQTLVLHKTCNGLKVDRSPLEPVSEEVVATSDLHLGVWTVNFRSTSASRRIIEIVHTDMGVVEEIDVTDVHSSFLISQMWGQPQWLPGERMLFYVAERHHPNWNDKDKREL